jgi:hypothetical protein
LAEGEAMRHQIQKSKRAAVFLSVAMLGFAIQGKAFPQSDKSMPARSQAANQAVAPEAKLPPLEIAREGYLFAGGK